MTGLAAAELRRLVAETYAVLLGLDEGVRRIARIPCLHGDHVVSVPFLLRMPGVKRLHQSSGNNSKPPYIRGHAFEAVSLLVENPASRGED
jgi:hypothetical protein